MNINIKKIQEILSNPSQLDTAKESFETESLLHYTSSLKYWFKKKYNLPSNDPRYLTISEEELWEEIYLEYLEKNHGLRFNLASLTTLKPAETKTVHTDSTASKKQSPLDVAPEPPVQNLQKEKDEDSLMWDFEIPETVSAFIQPIAKEEQNQKTLSEPDLAESTTVETTSPLYTPEAEEIIDPLTAVYIPPKKTVSQDHTKDEFSSSEKTKVSAPKEKKISIRNSSYNFRF